MGTSQQTPADPDHRTISECHVRGPRKINGSRLRRIRDEAGQLEDARPDAHRPGGSEPEQEEAVPGK